MKFTSYFCQYTRYPWVLKRCVEISAKVQEEIEVLIPNTFFICARKLHFLKLNVVSSFKFQLLCAGIGKKATILPSVNADTSSACIK
jgi:hypothetical protein